MEDKKEKSKQKRYYAFGKRVSKTFMESRCFKSSVLKTECCQKHCGSNIC